MYVATLFFDLSRAFDTIDIKFVKFKLDRLGIRGPILEWIISFLSQRKLVVNVNNVNSDKFNIDIGAAQGSVLAPLIFLLYINDLTLPGYMINFADDTSVVLSSTTLDELKIIIERAIQQMNLWCFSNRLILNEDKTVRAEFFKSAPHMSLDYQVEKVKFLGSYLDPKLSWSCQIDHICKKLNSSYFALLKLKHTVTPATLLQIYYSLVYPHLSYNIILWGTATEINRVFVAQKRTIRLMFNLGNRESCREYFREKKS